MRRDIVAGIAIVVVAAACVANDVRNTTPTRAGDSLSAKPDCSLRQLRAILVRDTAQLRRSSAATVLTESAEGGEIVGFFEGAAPRVIRAEYLGERGRATELFYVLDSLSFVRIRTESRYEKPLTLNARPVIVSSTSDTMWVCGERSVVPADSVAVRSALSSLFEVLRVVGK